MLCFKQLPIRMLNSFTQSKNNILFTNRGASGIDEISTAISMQLQKIKNFILLQEIDIFI